MPVLDTWWILSSGEVVNTSGIEHWMYVRDNPEKFDMNEEEVQNMMGVDLRREAIRKGAVWVRMEGKQDQLQVGISDIDNSILRAIKDLVERTGSSSVRVTNVSKQDTSTFSSSNFFDIRNTNALQNQIGRKSNVQRFHQGNLNKYIKGKLTVEELLGEEIFLENIFRGLRPGNTLEENLKKLYEVNFKYDVVVFNLSEAGGSGIGAKGKRLQNMKQKLKNRGREIINVVANQLLPVFEEWLSKHAITDPEEWAERVVEDEYVQRSIDDGNFELLITGLEDWAGGERPATLNFYKGFINWSRGNNSAKEFVNQFLNEEISVAETEEEQQRLADLRGDVEQIVNHLIQPLFPDGEQFLNFVADNLPFEFNDFLKFVMENQGFVQWYSYWSARGIDETRENVEQAKRLLEESKTVPIGEAFAKINQAINTSHQTGDMLEYIQKDNPGVTTQLLDDLSSGPEKDWVEDLQEAGLEIQWY